MYQLAKYITFVFLFTVFTWGQAAFAQSSEWKGIDKTQVRLISAMSAVGESDQIILGLHFKMQKGWKVYWRSPGDAGYPPEVDWKDTPAITNAEMRWPLPERFVVLGLETVGYKKEVVYPLHLKINPTDQPLDINAKVRFLTCAEVCIPVETDLSLTLPTGPAQASEHAQLINKFESLVPTKTTTYGVELHSAVLYSDADQKNGTLRVKLTSPTPLSAPDALIEGPIELAFFKPELKLSKDQKTALIDTPLDGLQFLENGFETADFTLTFNDGQKAFETTTKVSAGAGLLPTTKGFAPLGETALNNLPLITVLLLAVLGGLILNLMPCVLPVLSLKVLGLVSHGGGNPTTVRLSFLASTGGILFSFWVLAGVLIAMKAGGASIGWGIQFQQPLFLIALSLIVILFACNMWGLFEINLPSWLSNVGERSSHVHGLGGHFMTGAFATLLATPCSAPFLGTAVGFALSQGTVEILLVFSALGLGLALPYILIALFPALATRLPKPGQWMVILRKILGLALLATALWLLTVLWAQVGLNAALVLLALMGSVIFVLLFKAQLKTLTTPIVLTLFIAAFAVPSFAQKEAIDQEVAEKLWTKFDLAKIDELVAQGHVVFVDVTAEWCITCQVNKNLVLYQGEAFETLSTENVIAMKADWTNPDQVIADYLASFKRYAIPFNAVYGPAAPNGIVLPELLSEDDVLGAINKAKG
ncbi:Thiol:disulfide interchange protein dsbD 1 [Candidatus Terasakiella magnetica]|uniref:Thiol:disulfide interchange protein dsbD 1 n=1 Tax=Candidatus Terasakiella magnetica TaxID=1867952 RepID=A0A1C3RE69_9PROT|nr:protein-disulfide reductase DsbD domain-containing protein [Candidatus Terasakiella magnetica]SCA55587.1 Thiol:disulfide interchange protein dsbD 1 [Candidatus Terasakiella magnetica]